jgi:hypothetical protein
LFRVVEIPTASGAGALFAAVVVLTGSGAGTAGPVP